MSTWLNCWGSTAGQLLGLLGSLLGLLGSDHGERPTIKYLCQKYPRFWSLTR